MLLMLVTDQPDLACHAVECGVDRIFVDLEIRGKAVRQRGRGAHLSAAGPDAPAQVRRAIGSAQMLVRINGPLEADASEAELAVASGADTIMLPMFTDAGQVRALCAQVNGRAGVVPLAETAEATTIGGEVARLPGVAEMYVGLNDLSISFGLPMLFQAMLDPRFEQLCLALRAAGRPFGIGGVARIGEGRIPASLLLGEYLRLGASRVILSRAFRGGAASLAELRAVVDLRLEIRRLRDEVERLHERPAAQIAADTASLHERITSLQPGGHGGAPAGAQAGENSSSQRAVESATRSGRV